MMESLCVVVVTKLTIYWFPHQFQAFSTQLKSAHLSQLIQEKKFASQAHKSAQETQDPFFYVETKSYKHYYYRIKTITEGS
jgi:hypothetical protein